MIDILCVFSILALLSVLSVIDVKTHTLPNRLVLAVAFIAVLRAAFLCVLYAAAQPFFEAVLGTLAGGLPFALIIWLSKGGMGAGDMKLYAALGLYFGWWRILCVSILSIYFAGFFALGLLILKRANRHLRIPMAPFITVAAAVVLFAEPLIIRALRVFFHLDT